MKLGRYPSPQNSLTFLQSSHKLTKSVHSSLSKNLQHTADSMKLPSVPNMRKLVTSFSSVTTQRNTRNQLSSITRKIEDLANDLHNASMDAKETLGHISFVKRDLIDNRLNKDAEDLKSQINGLKKLVQITKTSHQNRSNQLREDYIRLWNQTEGLRQNVFELRMRIDKIEDTMGLRKI